MLIDQRAGTQPDVPSSSEGVGPEVDGRRLRRARNRTAAIDAMFQLLEETGKMPSTDEVANRSGLSVSSIFRYFDSVEDLRQESIQRYFERFSPLFRIPRMGEGSVESKVDHLVAARLNLFESIAPIARIARSRSIDHPRIAESLTDTRLMFAQQIREHFAPELEHLTGTAADDVVSLIDSLTTFEAWELQTVEHGRSEPQIRRTWKRGLLALLTA